MQSIHLIIHGLVQGVYYRQSTREMARELEINGTVKNCDDGTVEIFAEGDDEQIKKFIDWCHKGPRAARVDRIDIHQQTLKNFKGFIITR